MRCLASIAMPVMKVSDFNCVGRLWEHLEGNFNTSWHDHMFIQLLFLHFSCLASHSQHCCCLVDEWYIVWTVWKQYGYTNNKHWSQSRLPESIAEVGLTSSIDVVLVNIHATICQISFMSMNTELYRVTQNVQKGKLKVFCSQLIQCNQGF